MGGDDSQEAPCPEGVVARDSLRIHTGKRISVYDVVGPNRRGAGTC